MLDAMDLGTADYSECSCGEQAAQIAVAKVRVKVKVGSCLSAGLGLLHLNEQMLVRRLGTSAQGLSRRFGHARGMSANPPTAAQ